MSLLEGDDLRTSILGEGPYALGLYSILDPGQIGNVSVDIRLGYDFLVSVLSRQSYIPVEPRDGIRPLEKHFQETRRALGDRFIVYPGQLVLATSLEYLSLPGNLYADVLTRSSYTRLGIHMNTMIQPGFRGSIPLELFNHSNNPIELNVGARVCQVRFTKLPTELDYTREEEGRKYYGDVRPTLSRARDDEDIEKLVKIRSNRSTSTNG